MMITKNKGNDADGVVSKLICDSGRKIIINDNDVRDRKRGDNRYENTVK